MKKILFVACALAAFPSHSQSLLTGRVGYFPFDGNVEDMSGFNNDGTLNGPTYTTDRFGQANAALLFDGVDDYLTVGLQGMDPTQGTISMWLKPGELPSLNSRWHLFDTWSPQGTYNDERIILWKGQGSADGTRLVAGVDDYNKIEHDIANWNLADWHHVVMTWRGKNDGQDFVRIYVDGLKVNEISGNYSLNINSIGFNAVIGARFSTYERPFIGSLDDLSYYSRSLSDQEIQLLYAGPSSSDLVGFFPMDGNAADISGYANTGTMYSLFPGPDRFDNPNKALVFNGTSSTLTIGTNGVDPTEGTVAMWVKPETSPLSNTNYYVFFDTWSTQGNYANERIVFWKGSGGAHGTNLVCGIDGYNDFEYNPVGWVADSWYHLTWVWRAKNDGQDYIQLYVNGVKVHELTGLSKNITSVANTASIGVHFSKNESFFRGLIDEVKIYRKPLSETEVSELFNSSPSGSPSESGVWQSVNATVYVLEEKVGIGVSEVPENYDLAVKGKAIVEELNVQLVADWPDYVFEEGYGLMSLAEIKSYIATHKHLPEIPSAQEVKSDGVDVGEMNQLLLKKIEELTLYQIELMEELLELRKAYQELKSEIEK